MRRKTLACHSIIEALAYSPVCIKFIPCASLSSYCEENNYWVDEQNGFRPKRSWQDHIYVLSSAIRNRKSRGADTFCAFVYLQKAFDWVSRDLFLYKLVITFKIHGRLFNTLSSIYNSSAAQIRLNGKLINSSYEFWGETRWHNKPYTFFHVFKWSCHWYKGPELWFWHWLNSL